MKRKRSCPFFILLAVAFFAVVHPAAAQTETDIFAEAFDGVVAPALPPGWAATGGGWATGNGVASPLSGGNNLSHKGTQAGSAVTPALDLTGVSAGTLRYQARRSSSYARENLSVTASTDGGSTFPVTLLPAGVALPEGESYALVEVSLPPEVLGQAQVVLRFDALGGTSGSSIVRIDDVVLGGVRPIDVAPVALAFFTQAGGQQVLSFTVVNQSGAEQVLGAPQVTGTVFTVSPTGEVTLADGAAQAYDVTFAPPAEGSFSGTVTLSAAPGALVVPLQGTTAGGQFGFEAASSATLEENGTVDIPLVLDYAGIVPLQGLEFSVAWDDAALSFVDVVRGPAVSNAGQWRLSPEAAGQSVKVVLLGEGTTGLPAQVYGPLLWLRMASGTIAPQEIRTVRLTTSGLVGAQATPEGDDAGLVPGLATHDLTVERREAFFVPSATLLDLGTVAVGQAATADLTVTNTGGTRALSISAIDATNDRFTVSPATATLAPGASQTFTVTFTPASDAFGLQTGQFTFTHDGDGPAFTLDVAGVGVGGRGDADADGVVDVLDLVYGIDFVLGRLSATAAQRAAIDLHPFADGNGALDVRDLTVLVQAITAGRWPDALLLPAEVPPGPSKTALAEGARFELREEPDGWLLAIDHVLPLRAAQLILEVDGLAGEPVVLPDPVRPAEAALAAQGDPATGEVRVVLYRPDGGALAPGRYRIAAIPAARGAPHVAVRYATAVDGERNRVAVAVDVATVTAAETPPEAPDAFALGAPFPNPFRPGTAQALQVPVALPSAGTVTVEVYDVTGRRVAVLAQHLERGGQGVVVWDGRTPDGRRVGPGLYLLRAAAATGTLSRSVVVLP